MTERDASSETREADVDVGCEPVLRRAFELGRQHHGPLPLPFALFAAGVRDRVQRILQRAGGEATRVDVLRCTEQVAGADVFLVIACDQCVPGAWEAFVATFGPVLSALAARRGMARRVAEELGAELPGYLLLPPAAGTARTRLGTFDGASSLRTWLVTIVARRLANHLRDARRSLPDGQGTAADATLEPADKGPPLHELAALAEADRTLPSVVAAALASLSTRERVCLRLKYGHSATQREIAVILRVTESRVSQILKSACRELRSAIERGWKAVDASPTEWASVELALRTFLEKEPQAGARAATNREMESSSHVGSAGI
jgi:RNA polymerase sigma factor (sigma-70 family)